MTQQLASEHVIISSPLSFSGSAQRIWKLTQIQNEWVKWLLLAPIALSLVGLAWSFIFLWYCLFGLLLVPWRLFRRSQRKEKRRQLEHRELLEQLQKNNS